MSANDSEPWIIKEIEFITHTVTRGVAVLGVCLGAQLLAKGLGAPVKPGPRVELGPMPITVTQEGQGIQYLAPSQRPLRCFNDMVKDLTSRRVLSLWPHLSCMPLRPFDLALGCMVFSFISSWKQRGSKRYAENAPTLCTTVAPPQNCCFQRGPQSCPSRMNGLID